MNRILPSAIALVLPMYAGAAACERYEPPPTPVIEGLEGSVLTDAKAPLVVSFGKPIEMGSLDYKIAFYETDLEGNLFDEDDDPNTNLRVLVSHDQLDGDRGGTTEPIEDSSKILVRTNGAFPVGPKLVLVVEAGLRSPDGRSLRHRTRIPFSYGVKCTAGARAQNFTSGVYFALLDVEKPLGTQIQLLGAIEVDPATGLFLGQFTNADRNPDRSRCTPACGPSDACRLFPKQECVPPSTKAASAEEWPDFVPNAAPPTGYSFTVEGCAVDDDKGVGVSTAPATMVVESPPVTVAGLTMTAFFGPGPDGVVRATGSLTADAVLLNDNVIGPGKGTMTATLIPADKVPPDVPRPPARPSGGGGADGGR